MQITTKGRYAVMAMVDLAINANGLPIQLSAIATRQQIDFGYLEQIFIKLRKVELIKSTRGPSGGYQLAKPPIDITVFDIMNAVEESVQMTRCSKEKGNCMNGNIQCITHHVWENLENNINSFLIGINLQSICDKVAKKTTLQRSVK